MSCLLVTDVGTTSIKSTLFDLQLRPLASTTGEYSIRSYPDGRVELDPETYWTYFRRGLAAVCEQAGIHAGEIERLTFTTQGETLIPVDAGGRALGNAIVWLDTRAEAEAGIVSREAGADELYRRTGIADCNATCPISKLLWIKKHAPNLYTAASRFLLVEDYLILRLTGRFVSEKSVMSTTGYYDIYHDALWTELLEALGLDPGKLPETLDCGEEAGTVLPSVAAELGLSPRALVVTAAMDQIASTLGAGNVADGIITETTGTVLAIAATCGKESLCADKHVTVYKHALPGKYLYLPICMTGGMALKWFKDQFCAAEQSLAKERGLPVYRLLDELAEQSPPLSNGVLTLPYFNGTLQPQFNPAARGVFFGVGLENTRADFVRSILESVAYMLRENIEMIAALGGGAPSRLHCCGGGSRSSVWNQIKADVLGLNAYELTCSETTSIGAAALSLLPKYGEAGVVSLLEQTNPIRREYLPDPETGEAYRSGYARYLDLYQSLKGLF